MAQKARHKALCAARRGTPEIGGSPRQSRRATSPLPTRTERVAAFAGTRESALLYQKSVPKSHHPSASPGRKRLNGVRDATESPQVEGYRAELD